MKIKLLLPALLLVLFSCSNYERNASCWSDPDCKTSTVEFKVLELSPRVVASEGRPEYTYLCSQVKNPKKIFALIVSFASNEPELKTGCTYELLLRKTNGWEMFNDIKYKSYYASNV